MKKVTPSIDQVNVLIRIRQATSLTQQEFADRLGVDRSIIANMERGVVQHPRLALLPALVEQFGVNPYCLVREGEPLFSPENQADKNARHQHETLLSQMQQKINELSALVARSINPETTAKKPATRTKKAA